MALEILGDQRVVGRLQPVLHGQIKAGRRLAAAADANQDHVGLGEKVETLQDTTLPAYVGPLAVAAAVRR